MENDSGSSSEIPGDDDFFIPTTGGCNKSICTGAVGDDGYFLVTVSARTWIVKSTDESQVSALKGLVNASDALLGAIEADTETLSRQFFRVNSNLYRVGISTTASLDDTDPFHGSCNKSICTPGVGANQTRVYLSARSWFVNPARQIEMAALGVLQNLLGALIATTLIQNGSWIEVDVSEATWLVDNGTAQDDQLTALKNGYSDFLRVLDINVGTSARQNIQPPSSDAP
ncbi:MAG: hypothetical protein JWQ90_372 [Hydrocarboniphaga sp.]|uniref:hypothetical protein n=1 Tax=Hydrocarboniphaga sp. TaxID=2033016 RepID=UPI002603730C|nr:hypothetical protein [Hydrocarboniphaga sp.]MDB5967922.1 hypothetical protein [Hydrocarboniphaga sp.]